MESRLARLLDLLKDSPAGSVFNPWWQFDPENDVGPEAPVIRRKQLLAYLSDRLATARLVLIGEALGYRGGHFTGLAMTSERMLLGRKAGIEPSEIFSGTEPQRTSKGDKCSDGFSEATATVVWRTMRDLGVPANRFVLWNVFPWHPYDPRTGMLSNRTPTTKELEAGHPVLDAFLNLFSCEWVAALGRLAASRLPLAEPVRHPASGGPATFRRQIAAFVAAKARFLAEPLTDHESSAENH